MVVGFFWNGEGVYFHGHANALSGRFSALVAESESLPLRHFLLRSALWYSDGCGEGAGLGDLSYGDDVFPSIAASEHGFFRDHDGVSWLDHGGQCAARPQAAASACYFSIGAKDEDSALVGELSRASRPREIPSGVLSSRVRNGVRVVHLSNDENEPRLLGHLQHIPSAEFDIVCRAAKILAFRPDMHNETAGTRSFTQSFEHALLLLGGALL